MHHDALFAPSVGRNREPILAILRRILARSSLVLEIASGTGEHAVHVAAALPTIAWQPSDAEPEALRSIIAHRSWAALPNLLPPIELDVRRLPWPVRRADAIVAINMIHIAPWAATEALMVGAQAVLPPSGLLFLYGPFFETDRDCAQSNLAFDHSLRDRNPEWGIRRLDDVVALAAGRGLHFRERVEMPANNLGVVFSRPM